MAVQIAPARAVDCAALTALSMAAKASHGYDAAGDPRPCQGHGRGCLNVRFGPKRRWVLPAFGVCCDGTCPVGVDCWAVYSNDGMARLGLGFEVQRHTVDAIPLARGLWSIGKDMAQMRRALVAVHFGAGHQP